MGVFGNLGRRDRKEERTPSQSELPLTTHPAADVSALEVKFGSSRSTGRTEVYAVRVRQTFKAEIRRAVIEIELERQNAHAQARKVTEGEVMELMLDALKAVRRNGGVVGHAVPLADDVWRGAVELGRRMQSTPGEVIEQLVVHKIAELGLLERAK